MKVLLIDRSTGIRKLMSISVRNAGGVVVAEAGFYVDGLELAVNIKPDVIIMDVTLSGGAGPDLLKALRRLLPSTKLIAMYSLNIQQYVGRFTQLGADYVLDKYEEFDLLDDILIALKANQHNSNSKSTDGKPLLTGN